MKTEEQASTIVQARWRGYRCRKEKNRIESAAVKIQAIQRGRSTRKEFKQYLAIEREQNVLQEQRRKRHNQILKNKRDLNLLQNTPIDILNKYFEIQKRAYAKKIQRCWRRGRTVEAAEDSNAFESESDVSWIDGYDTEEYSTDEEDMDVIFTEEIIDSALQSAKRIALEQRIARLSQSDMDLWKKSDSNSNLRSRKALLMHRYRKFMELKHGVTRNCNMYFRKGSIRDEAERKRRLTMLRCESLIQKISNPLPFNKICLDSDLRQDEEGLVRKTFDDWMDEFHLPKSKLRLERARVNHKNRMKVLNDNNAWWRVFVDGKRKDIRKIIPPWPWQNQDPEHLWPESSVSSDPLNPDVRIDSKTASVWWSTFSEMYCEQPCGERSIPPTALSTVKGGTEPLILSKRLNEAYYNESVQRINKKALQLKKRFIDQIDTAVSARSSARQADSLDTFRQQVLQDTAASNIQKMYRGHAARSRVRGLQADRLMHLQSDQVGRLGLCEECGESKAVLKCAECVETTAFCPQCWVHVHSTRRRQRHTAIPLSQ